MLLFSIVIPAYNYGRFLKRSVDSALQQSGGDYEVLVINDGSTDNTQKVLDQLHKSHQDRFRSLNIKNSGSAAVRNLGIDNTTGTFLLFLDADDELLPDALTHFRSAIAKYQQRLPGIISGAHIAVFSNGRERLLPAGLFSSSKDDNFKRYLITKKNIRLSNGALVMHRKVFNNYRYPEQFRNSEDIPVFAYVLANFNCVAIEPAINKVHKHPTSLRHNYQYAIDVAEKLVDEVFDQKRIPDNLQCYKKQYTATRSLSLFRTFYHHKDYCRAKKYYIKAIKHDWRLLFKLSNVIKYIISFIRYT